MKHWIPVAVGFVLAITWELMGLGIGSLIALVIAAFLVLWACDKLSTRSN